MQRSPPSRRSHRPEVPAPPLPSPLPGPPKPNLSAELNNAFRGKDSPTDVLSFAMDQDDDPEGSYPYLMLGDCAISVDTARRQAEERGYALEDEVREGGGVKL